MSSTEKTDYDKLVKDHVRMRLMESGWTDQLSHIVKNAIVKRVTEGQATNTIKFEQLYSDVIDEARDAVPEELEMEFHEKIGEYLSLKHDKTSEASSSSVIPSISPQNSANNSNVTPDTPSSNIHSDIPLEVISNENT